jgi:hypothetical protein
MLLTSSCASGAGVVDVDKSRARAARSTSPIALVVPRRAPRAAIARSSTTRCRRYRARWNRTSPPCGRPRSWVRATAIRIA